MFRTGQLAFVSKRYLNTTAKPTHLQKYIEAMSSHAATFPQGILESLQAETRQKFSDSFKMIPIHQAQLLYSFTRIIRPENVLEIGTFTGMSTISIAAGTQGKITTIERDMEAITVAKTWLEKANMSEQVTIEEGIALDMLVKQMLRLVLIMYPPYLQCLCQI
jgi:predicted O-methyltransferase YrrM